MKQYLSSQFGHPRGIAGWLVGQIMARENRERIDWAVSQLAVNPDDRVLEVGVGPGLGIEKVAERAVDGLVAGIDLSSVMVRQARKRNAVAIQEGRVEVRQGTVSTLPYEGDSFDKAFAINSLHHWPDPAGGLRELWRVLKPGGMVAIMEQPHGAQEEAAVRRRGDELAEQLDAAGFRGAVFAMESLQRGTAIYVTGVKPLNECGGEG